MSIRRVSVLSASLAVVAVPALVACGFRAYSPPAGWSPAESPAPLARDKNSLAGAIHLGGGIFGPSVLGGSMSVRHGLTDSYEIQANASYVQITEESRTQAFKGIVSGRVGLKGLFEKDFKHISWNASIGGGGHAGGGFVSPEVGIQFGYENPFFIPWFRASVFLSQPLGPKGVDIAPQGEEDPDVDVPKATFGVRLVMGFTIAFDEDFPFRVHFINEMVYLNRVDGRDDGILGLGLGIETFF